MAGEHVATPGEPVDRGRGVAPDSLRRFVSSLGETEREPDWTLRGSPVARD